MSKLQAQDWSPAPLGRTAGLGLVSGIGFEDYVGLFDRIFASRGLSGSGNCGAEDVVGGYEAQETGDAAVDFLS